MKKIDDILATSIAYECCICHKEFLGYGNNPYPVAKKGKCCDECNSNHVIPARFLGLRSKKSKD